MGPFCFLLFLGSRLLFGIGSDWNVPARGAAPAAPSGPSAPKKTEKREKFSGATFFFLDGDFNARIEIVAEKKNCLHELVGRCNYDR